MNVLKEHLRVVLWVLVLALAVSALGLQAVVAHHRNLKLRDQTHGVERDLRRLDIEQKRLRRQKKALETDSYAVERELRKRGLIRDGEGILRH